MSPHCPSLKVQSSEPERLDAAAARYCAAACLLANESHRGRLVIWAATARKYAANLRAARAARQRLAYSQLKHLFT